MNKIELKSIDENHQQTQTQTQTQLTYELLGSNLIRTYSMAMWKTSSEH